MISLEGDPVSLRPLRPDELETVWQARLSDDTAPWMSTPQAYERLKQRVANSGRFVDGWLDLGIEAEGRLVGEIDARQPPRSMPQGVFELGISLFDTADRGRGLGTDAIRLLISSQTTVSPPRNPKASVHSTTVSPRLCASCASP